MKPKTLVAAIFSVALLIGASGGIYLINSSADIFAKSTKLKSSSSKIFEVEDFDKIEIAGSIDVKYVQGNSTQVVARGPEDFLRYLSVDVTDGRLNIGFSQTYYEENNSHIGMSVSDLERIKIVVTSPDLNEISVALSANFDAPEIVANGTLKINSSLSSDVDIVKLSAAGLDVDCCNSGDVEIGIATLSGGIKANVSTSGDLKMKQTAMCGNIDIVASTSGSVKISGINKADRTIIDVSTSATVKLDGKGDSADYTATTGGSINARNFVTQKATLDSSIGGTIDYNSRHTDSPSNRNYYRAS